MLYAREKILRGFDEDIRDHLTNELVKRASTLFCGTEIAEIDKGWTTLHLKLQDGRKLDSAAVMFATGRAPNTPGLGLDKAGRQARRKGPGARGCLLQNQRRQHLCGRRVTDRAN